MLIRWSAPGPGGREYERLYNVEAQFRSLLNKRVRPRQKHQPLKGMGGCGACAGLPVAAGRAGAIDFGGDRQAACKTLSPIPNTPLAIPRLAGGGLAAGLAGAWRWSGGGLVPSRWRPGGSLAVDWRWTGSVRAERLVQPGEEPGQAQASTTGGKRGPEGSDWERIEAQRISSILRGCQADSWQANVHLAGQRPACAWRTVGNLIHPSRPIRIKLCLCRL
jgi:hypothetical protein